MGVVGVLLLMVDLSMVGVGEELKRTNKQTNKTKQNRCTFKTDEPTGHDVLFGAVYIPNHALIAQDMHHPLVSKTKWMHV